MKILFCNFEYPPLGGGGGVMNALLAEELTKRHEVTVLTSQGLGLPGESVQNGVRIVRAPVYFRKKDAAANLLSMLAFLPQGILAGRRLLRDHRYDVINTHFVLPTGPVGDALARFGAIPNVLSLHGGDLYDPSKFTSPHRHLLLRAWIRRLLRRADVVVGQSRNTLENMQRMYTREIEAVRIPLGIQRPKADTASRTTYGLRENEIVLVTVGRLVARKAVHQLIALMGDLKSESARLLVIGTGPLERQLKEEAKRRRVGDRVLFLGHVEEAEKFGILQMCDMYVSTSQHEGFGLVFLEAMACSLPVVCYAHGGQTDFLEDGRSGYLLSLNDLTGFEAQCRRLMKDHDLRRRMGRENIQRVEEYFIDRCAQRYEAVFKAAIAASTPRTTYGDTVRP